MPKVRFIDQNIEIEVPVGSSILQAAREAHAPEGDACGGQCACSTCHVYVQQGLELLSEAEEEGKYKAKTPLEKSLAEMIRGQSGLWVSEDEMKAMIA